MQNLPLGSEGVLYPKSGKNLLNLKISSGHDKGIEPIKWGLVGYKSEAALSTLSR